ncbi:MAG: hypothetical protein ABIO55_04500, partial [Ginsengibacter sp.]
EPNNQAYFGFGIGQDYGAIGIRAEYLPSKYVGLFGGFGFALIDPAFNAGLSAKLLTDKKICPTITAMYGYNAVIYLKNVYGSIIAEKSKVYYGATVGAGADLKFGRSNRNKLSLSVFLPFRNSEFHKNYNDLKDAGFEFNPEIMPVTFSIGLNFGVSTNTNRK